MPNQGGSRDHERSGQKSHKNDDMKHGQQGGGMGRPGQQHAEESGSGQQRGGSGNFANDPKRASDAVRKGGQS